MTKTLTILILFFSFPTFSQDNWSMSQDSLRSFYNKTIINTLTDSLDKKECEKYGFILIKTDFDTTGLVKTFGDITFRYFSSKTPLQNVLDKPYKKHVDQTIYVVNHILFNRDSVDVNMGRQKIGRVDKKTSLIRSECAGAMGYFPTGRFVYNKSSNNWAFIPGSVFVNRAIEYSRKKTN